MPLSDGNFADFEPPCLSLQEMMYEFVVLSFFLYIGVYSFFLAYLCNKEFFPF